MWPAYLTFEKSSAPCPHKALAEFPSFSSPVTHGASGLQFRAWCAGHPIRSVTSVGNLVLNSAKDEPIKVTETQVALATGNLPLLA